MDRQHRQGFGDRLRNQHTIERVAVVKWQRFYGDRMARQQQRLKAKTLHAARNVSSRRLGQEQFFSEAFSAISHTETTEKNRSSLLSVASGTLFGNVSGATASLRKTLVSMRMRAGSDVVAEVVRRFVKVTR